MQGGGERRVQGDSWLNYDVEGGKNLLTSAGSPGRGVWGEPGKNA